MSLTKKIYEEIIEKETTWIGMINENLLNIFYLPELKKFYSEKKYRFDYEFQLTENDIIKSISHTLNRIIQKIDYIIEQDKIGNSVKLTELSNLFLINKLTNNVPLKKKKIEKINENKKNLYELRNKVINEELDDDFYYKERGKAI